MSGVTRTGFGAWEDVEIDQELPSHEYTLGDTETVLQVSGSQDWAGIHHNRQSARDSGHDSTFFNTAWTQGLLSRVVTDWMGGASGWLSRLEFQMRQMNLPGDTVRTRGRVTGKEVRDDGIKVVWLDVWIENDRLGVTTPGTAEVLFGLPPLIQRAP